MARCAIKETIPFNPLNAQQMSHKIYASEADVLNVAFWHNGIKKNEWKIILIQRKNIRDHANVSIAFSQFWRILNALFISEGLPQVNPTVEN